MLWLFVPLAFLVALLFVPWSLRFVLYRQPERKNEVHVSWGGLEIELDHFRSSERERTEARQTAESHAAEKEAERASERARRKSAQRGKGPSFQKLKATFLNRELLSSLVRLARRLLHQMRPQELDLAVYAGLGEPYETGRLCALISPALIALWSSGVDALRFVPDFDRRCLQLEGSGRVRIVPALLLGTLLAYLLTPPIWRAIKRYRV